MRKTHAIILAFTLAFSLLTQNTSAQNKRVSLFNGKDLECWTILKCEAEVDNGNILLKSGNGLLQTKNKYSDFVLEFEWKALAEDKWDSGVYFRYNSVPENRPWPPRYQANLRKGMEGNVGDVKGATSQGLIKERDWNKFKLTVNGSTLELQINDQQAWKADGLAPEAKDGFIALQAEVPQGGQHLFRNIYITELQSITEKPKVSSERAEKITAAIPKQATAKPAKPRKILVLSYQSHDDGRFAGELALELMAANTGAFELTFVRDPKQLPEVVMPDYLKQFDAVCVNNSTGGGGKALNDKELVDNLDEYVMNGGGLIGIHSATDNRFGKVFGGFFTGHPWSEEVGIKIDDPKHPLCKAFECKGFMVSDEIYQFDKGEYSREKLHVLLSLDMAKTKDKGKRADKDNAVAWVKTHGKGRVFYGSLGHRPDIFFIPAIMQFYLDGIQFALGDLDVDTTPSAQLNPQPEPALVP